MIDQVVLGELRAADWGRLRQHLKGCEQCRDRYNRAVLAERMLHGGPQSIDRPQAPELDRVERALFDAAEERGWARMRKWFTPPVRWATAATMTLAAVVLVPLLLRSPGAGPSATSETPETLVARGGAPAVSGARTAGLQAFCMTDDVPLRELTPSGSRCALSAQLKLAITNPAGYFWVFLVGVDDAYDVLWYVPRPPATQSVPAIAAGPIGGAIKLGFNHVPGPLRIYALFSDAPLSAEAVTEAVVTLKATGQRPSATPTLPIAGAPGQRSLLVELDP
jgi:hypothetical protein